MEKTLSHSGERFRRRGGGSIKIFRRNFFVSLPKVSIGDSFSVSLISAIELVWKKGGEYQHFPSKFFCLTVPEDFVGGGWGVEYQHFPSKLFCLTVPKFSVGKPFSVSLISGIAKV